MIHHRQQSAGRAWRAALLAGTAAAAFGMVGAAMAQQPAPAQQRDGTQQGGSQRPSDLGQLRTAEQSLRHARQQIEGTQQPNYGQARTAVAAGMSVLNRMSSEMQGEDVWRTAQRELNEAQQAVQASQPNHGVTATKLREAADALAALAGRMESSDAMRARGGLRADSAAQQPQAEGQPQRPQITVQQQQPRITVTQPPPQVTIQQAEPRVTVQQAQPQVRVQQAEPQVQVLQPGQPQVTVQRQVEPQVTAQGQAGARQPAGQGSAAPTAPGGAQPQQPAASGMPLQSVQALVGTNVQGANGRDAGEVRNLLLDGEGRVRAAVIEWGGFLGIGTREALVPIERIRLGQGNDPARLEMTRDELEALPRYDRDNVGAYGRDRGWGTGLRLWR